MKQSVNKLADVLGESKAELLDKWTRYQLQDESRRSDLLSDAAVKSQSSEFLELFLKAIQKNENLTSISGEAWSGVLAFLSDLSASRARQGFTPTETAKFVFSMKQPLFEVLNSRYGKAEAGQLAEDIWSISYLQDQLGLYTTEVFQKSREAIIKRQQKDILEMSTPVIKLWDGILVVPLIGTLDSARTQTIMETLLEEIVKTGSKIALLDITGVPTVDTQTAQHLIKTVTAARLMGADCMICGIRPQIAQTIVHLGIDIVDVTTKATMADAIKESLGRMGWTISRVSANQAR